jgi:hypothetical protein
MGNETYKGTAMTQRILPQYPCPKCGQKIQGVEIDEDAIINAPRIPVLVKASCSRGHQVVLFVDRNFNIREAEPVVSQSKQKKSKFDKAKG